MKKLLCLVLLSSSALAARVTVSGISSGAYMAQQLHTAFSAEISGVGIIAGGPFFCAKGQMILALNSCMNHYLGIPEAEESLAEARKLERSQDIDALSHLEASRVFILAGKSDETVRPKVVDTVEDFYLKAGVAKSDIKYVTDLDVGHAFPTLNHGNPCPTKSEPPFISACARDIAGEILSHMGHVRNARGRTEISRFFTYGQDRHENLQDRGVAYVPKGCEASGACDIHIALHGCRQTRDDLKDEFFTRTGYVDWAESNRLIVLFPQAKKSLGKNPNGCWDWWGYTGKDYHTKNGPQMKAIMKAVRSLKNGTLGLESLGVAVH